MIEGKEENKKVCIVEDPALLERWCTLCDRTFNCRDGYICDASCLVALLVKTQALINTGESLGRAFKGVLEARKPKDEEGIH